MQIFRAPYDKQVAGTKIKAKYKQAAIDQENL
jgi:hypothetical protein